MSTKAHQAQNNNNGFKDSISYKERLKLQRTNELLENKVKVQTTALKRTNEQLESEIVERKKSEKQLQRRITFDHILTTLASNFINLSATEIDDGIVEALENVATFHQCHRAYIYLLEEDGQSLTTAHHWQKTEGPSQFSDFSNLPFNLFTNWLPRLQKSESFTVQNISDAEEESENERKLLAIQGVKSALIIPLVCGFETIGFLGLDTFSNTFRWQNDAVDGLKMAAIIFTNALTRKNTETTLLQEQYFAQQIMGSMGQGLVVSSIEGTFEYVNAAYAQMVGYEPDELVGKTSLDLTHHEDKHKLIQAQMQNLEGLTTSFEARLCRTDSRWVYVLVNSVPNFDQHGHVIGTISTVTDLTERRNNEAKIEANAEEVKLIYQAAVQLFQPSSVQELAEQIATITVEQLGFDDCGVLILKKPIRLSTDRIQLYPVDADNYLEWLARIGRFQDDKNGRISLTEDGLVTTAVRKGEVIYAPDVAQDPRYIPYNTTTQSQMIIPLRAYNHIIGAIDLQSPHTNGFDERARRIITVFAENAGLALETVRLYDKLRHHAQELEMQIGKRKRIEQALRHSEQRYKQLVENATDIIYRTDAEGFCTYANPVTLQTLGYTDEQALIGHHFTNFIHPEFQKSIVNAYNKQLANRTENTYFEFIALDKEQNEIWLGQNVQLISEQNEIVGFQALARDITKRRETEKELRRRSNELNATNAKLAKALRAKDEFLANMSHELRTPLNAILGKSEILLEGIQGPLNEKQASSIEVIGASGNHLLELINDILDMAKIEAGKITLDIQKVSLTNLCESSLQFVRQMAAKKQIRLQTDVDRTLKTFDTDERRLKQIIINLLSNAVKFTPPGGEVGLNVLKDKERHTVQFQVWDTGIGIPQENMEQLFKPFVQLDSSLARSHEGTGLGLSLVYRLADLLGGSVSLESQVGVGSCFTITLPRHLQTGPEQLQNQAEKDRQQFNSVYLRKSSGDADPLILLVEDNETSIETVSEYLANWGYCISVAHNGAEVLERAKQELPDLILMDIQIPGLDGLSAVRQLRQEETVKNIPVVALTALAMSGDRERCLAAGADEYMSKPIQMRQLIMTINKLLANRPKTIKEPNHA